MTAATFDLWVHQRRRGRLSIVASEEPGEKAFGA
jgi:hypothetical protein